MSKEKQSKSNFQVWRESHFFLICFNYYFVVATMSLVKLSSAQLVKHHTGKVKVNSVFFPKAQFVVSMTFAILN